MYGVHIYAWTKNEVISELKFIVSPNPSGVSQDTSSVDRNTFKNNYKHLEDSDILVCYIYMYNRTLSYHQILFQNTCIRENR